MRFIWHTVLLLRGKARKNASGWGTRRGLHLSNAVVDDSHCNAALLVINLFGSWFLHQVPIVSGDARLAITNGEPDKH